MNNGHRTVFQNAWSQKKQHFHWKKTFCSKKSINLYEKMPQNRLPKYLKPKKQTLSLKKQFCFKKAYKFIWKKATEPFSEMPESRETNTFIEKTILLFMVINSYERHRTVLQNAGSQKTKHSPWKYNSVWKKLINSYEKRPQNRLPKCLKQKKQTVSLKKQFRSKTTYKFIWKKATEPSSKIPEAKKTNTVIEKTILFQKSFYNGVRIHRKWNWESHYLQSISRIEKKNHIHRIFRKIHRIYFSNSGRYFLGKTNSAIASYKKHSPKPKSCQKLKKSSFQYFFN